MSYRKFALDHTSVLSMSDSKNICLQLNDKKAIFIVGFLSNFSFFILYNNKITRYSLHTNDFTAMHRYVFCLHCNCIYAFDKLSQVQLTVMVMVVHAG